MKDFDEIKQLMGSITKNHKKYCTLVMNSSQFSPTGFSFSSYISAEEKYAQYYNPVINHNTLEEVKERFLAFSQNPEIENQKVIDAEKVRCRTLIEKTTEQLNSLDMGNLE